MLPESPTSRPRVTPRLSRLATLLAIVLLMTSGCGLMRTRSEYRVSIPTLRVAPQSVTCLTSSGVVDCVVVASEDFRAVVRELKACCIANHGSAKDCETDQ